MFGKHLLWFVRWNAWKNPPKIGCFVKDSLVIALKTHGCWGSDFGVVIRNSDSWLKGSEFDSPHESYMSYLFIFISYPYSIFVRFPYHQKKKKETHMVVLFCFFLQNSCFLKVISLSDVQKLLKGSNASTWLGLKKNQKFFLFILSFAVICLNMRYLWWRRWW